MPPGTRPIWPCRRDLWCALVARPALGLGCPRRGRLGGPGCGRLTPAADPERACRGRLNGPDGAAAAIGCSALGDLAEAAWGAHRAARLPPAEPPRVPSMTRSLASCRVWESGSGASACSTTNLPVCNQLEWAPARTCGSRHHQPAHAAGEENAKVCTYAVANTAVSPVITRGGRYAISPSRSRMMPTTSSCERIPWSRLSNSVTEMARLGSSSSRNA